MIIFAAVFCVSFTTILPGVESSVSTLYAMSKGGDQSGPSFSYSAQNVTFKSEGIDLVGWLFTPNGKSVKYPAITILGPFTFVKEQSPMQYATRLAEYGYVTLIFDPRNHGESGGEPRRYESPALKVRDVSASIDFLQTQTMIDPNRIGALGICQGASEMLGATGHDKRIKALAGISGQYLVREEVSEFFGGEEGLNRRLARGDEAKRKYQQTGVVDYLPIVDENRTDVGLPTRGAWEWYHGWVPRSRWENRYAVMSDAEVWRFDTWGAAGNVTCPFLMVHADRSAGPATARRIFAEVPSKIKKLAWQGDIVQTQFYDEPLVIDPAVAAVADFMNQNL